jgi:NAD(P)-dependent dehydrogenase (short-subunit alcohol dehydrogenase family)
MAGRLEGKIALITGGSSGIGRASALIFAREGAKLVIADISIEGGEETVKMVKATGGKAIFIKTDVSLEADVKAMVDKTVETYGRLDCAFNNAGVGGRDWDHAINVNLKGVWLCIMNEVPQMIKQGGGAIVNTSSIAGLVARPGVNAYGASKHGVIGLTKSAAVEYAKNHIRVNAVCPNYIHTPLIARTEANKDEVAAIVAETPMGRFGEPSEVGEAAAWLLSDAASYVTGISMPVDGGFTAH